MLASSRGPCVAARPRGRDKSRPYELILCFGPNRNGRSPPGGRRAGCPHPAGPPAAANTPVLNRRGAAGVNARPTEPGKHGGQPGTPHRRNPCRGRCSHRPGDHAPPQGFAGGINPAPTNKFCVSDQTGTAAPHQADVGRDALIPPDHAPPQGSAGGINPVPTNKFCVSGQTGTAAANSSFLIPNFYSPRSPSRSGCRNKMRRPWSRWS